MCFWLGNYGAILKKCFVLERDSATMRHRPYLSSDRMSMQALSVGCKTPHVANFDHLGLCVSTLISWKGGRFSVSDVLTFPVAFPMIRTLSAVGRRGVFTGFGLFFERIEYGEDVSGSGQD